MKSARDRMLRALDRANGFCERCGARDGRPHPRVGVWTTLRIESTTGEPVLRCKAAELVAVCADCQKNGRHLEKQAPAVQTGIFMDGGVGA